MDEGKGDDLRLSLLLKMIERQGEQLDQLAQNVSKGHDRSSDSRAKLHERIDHVAEKLGKIEGDIQLLGKVDGQVMRDVAELAATVKQNRLEIEPAVVAWEDFGKLMKTGGRISMVFGISGVTILGAMIGFFLGAYDMIVGWLRSIR